MNQGLQTGLGIAGGGLGLLGLLALLSKYYGNGTESGTASNETASGLLSANGIGGQSAAPDFSLLEQEQYYPENSAHSVLVGPFKPSGGSGSSAKRSRARVPQQQANAEARPITSPAENFSVPTVFDTDGRSSQEKYPAGPWRTPQQETPAEMRALPAMPYNPNEGNWASLGDSPTGRTAGDALLHYGRFWRDLMGDVGNFVNPNLARYED